jgi:deazaflavin-dependent oxidoreductase (nitroreductase family)
LPREIEIWFVVWCERLYLFAETREAAGWVKNIRRNPNVTVRIGEWHRDATARVLDRHTDCKLWEQVVAIAVRKYGWGDGLPVEITPLPHTLPFRIKNGLWRASLNRQCDVAHLESGYL